MGMVKDIDSDQLVKATQLWTGWGVCSWPQIDDTRVIDAFGQQVADNILPHVRQLCDAFYESDARLTCANLQEMGELAAKEFERRYPSIPKEVIRLFVWCYTFDYK